MPSSVQPAYSQHGSQLCSRAWCLSYVLFTPEQIYSSSGCTSLHAKAPNPTRQPRIPPHHCIQHVKRSLQPPEGLFRPATLPYHPLGTCMARQSTRGKAHPQEGLDAGRQVVVRLNAASLDQSCDAHEVWRHHLIPGAWQPAGAGMRGIPARVAMRCLQCGEAVRQTSGLTTEGWVGARLSSPGLIRESKPYPPQTPPAGHPHYWHPAVT